jgi:hypothetical protein
VPPWLGPALVAALGFATWTWRLAPLARARRERTARASPRAVPTVSIIVPARNEATNLPALLASLARLEPAPLEIIVVDDDSSDGTGELARRAGARVVRPGPRPAGWLGKPWACAAGAAVARGDWLLFTDADTVHAPDSLATAAGAAATTGAGLVSVVPAHVAVAPWEHLQGVFHLLLAIATRAGAGARAGERRFCIGQYLLFSRACYEGVGGHAAVRDRVAEDLAFAALATRAGQRYQLVGVPGLVQVRMYPGGLSDFIAGWRRNFREGVRSAGPGGVLELTMVLGWLLGAPLWTALALARGSVAGLVAGALAWALAAVEIARRQRGVLAAPRAATALAFPLFAALFAVVTVLATLDVLRRAPVSWKGRRIAVAR